MSLDVLIVEDEEVAARRMRKLLGELDPGIRVVGSTGSIRDTVAWLSANADPDMAFFDIQLSDGESFEIFRQVAVEFPVVFTTAYDEHALRAFKVKAMDYLLKPVKRAELQNVLERLERMRVVRDHGATRKADEEAGSGHARRFLIRYGDLFKVVVPEEIAYLYSMEKSTFLRTRQGKDLPMDESLDRLEKQLDPEHFFRLNRKLIIRFESIQELVAYSKSRVKVVLDPPFAEDAIVSSERSASFKQWLGGK